MDPSAVTNAEWSQLGSLLTGLWIMVGFVVFFATNMLIGHIFIPSLVASHHIPAGIEKTRIVFYVLAILGMIAVFITLVGVINDAAVIHRIYDTYWIKGNPAPLNGGVEH
ncbi:MAG: hypothetical protein FJ319_01270 [SAR202 cluster bacterium]|nr:hypothetical protein [SAR202 cluster bacterium]